LNKEIESLKEELETLKSQMVLKSTLLSQKIADLEARLVPTLPEEPTVSEKIATRTPSTPQPPISKNTSSPKRPSLINQLVTQFLAMIFEWFTPVVNIYSSYKARGMLGIAILTIAGVGLVMFGFAYLLQLVIDELAAGAKSALLGSTALAVVAGGLYLKAKTKYSEYASAIVSLGLLLCFITIYFVGSVYSLLPALITLSLYAFIAFACHYLALYLETKVVAVMGIIGITLIPMIAGTSNIAPTFYLVAVWLVSLSSLIIAYRYLGYWLSNTTFVFSFITLGWVESNSNVEMAAWMINAFYLLFFGYLMFCLYREKTHNSRLLILLAANFGASLLLLLQSEQFGFEELASQFLINTAISLITSYVLYREGHRYTHLGIIISGAWLALAIVAVLTPTYWGVAWAIEGLLLIYMSLRYDVMKLIHHGQGLCTLALAYCIVAVFPYFPVPALLNLDGWLVVIVIGATISIWQRLISPFTSENQFNRYIEKHVYPVLIIFEAAWVSLIVLACAYIWLGFWAGLSAITVQTALMFRARQTKLAQLELLSVGLILFPLAYVLLGANQVDTYRFSQLPIFAQSSLVLAFTQLWLWSAFYRKFYPTSKFAKLSETARLAFYFLLPICWIGSAYRHLQDDILLVLWLSPLTSLVLANLIRSKLIALQSKVLSVALIIITTIKLVLANAYESSTSIWVSNFVALSGLVVIASTAFYLSKKHSSKQHSNHFVQSAIVNVAAILIGLFLVSMLSDVSLMQTALLQAHIIAMLIVTSYSLWVLFDADRFEVFARNGMFHLIVLGLISVVSWLLLSEGSRAHLHFALYPSMILGVAMYIAVKQGRLPSLNQLVSEQIEKHHKHADLIVHSYAVITYLLILNHLSYLSFDLAIAPVLAAHGAAVLFLKNRHIVTVRYGFALIAIGILKLAFIDTAQVILWQKVVLFIGIGVFILFASFWYQKIIAKDKKDESLSFSPD
jgi:hypothetical protein